MIKCHVEKIETPKNFILHGLLFNPEKKSKVVYIFVHGLGGGVFSRLDFLEKLAGKDVNVLTLNTRGHGIISKIRKSAPKNGKKAKSFIVGTAHEVFTDCVDDLDGAVECVKNLGAKKIILIGHSTGCQKSIYYLSKRKDSVVNGVVLLAPMSDYADTFAFSDKKVYKKAVAYAKQKVAQGQKHALLPENIWPNTLDAQRFLSLYTPESAEEIFTYASGKKPTTLKKVNKPILTLLAEEDEFRDRPSEEIAGWFEKTLSGKDATVGVVKGANHGFIEHTPQLVKIISAWAKNRLK